MNYTRCNKCKHKLEPFDKCGVTNDGWLVSDEAGICHQFEALYKGYCFNCKHAYIDEDSSLLKCELEKIIINPHAMECNDFVSCGCDVNTYNEKTDIEVDNIKPAHYNAGKYDVIWFCEYHKLDFTIGNVIKYAFRAGKKDKGKEIQDLEKAKEYINRRIESLKEK